jgi:hypothetical protein
LDTFFSWATQHKNKNNHPKSGTTTLAPLEMSGWPHSIGPGWPHSIGPTRDVRITPYPGGANPEGLFRRGSAVTQHWYCVPSRPDKNKRIRIDSCHGRISARTCISRTYRSSSNTSSKVNPYTNKFATALMSSGSEGFGSSVVPRDAWYCKLALVSSSDTIQTVNSSGWSFQGTKYMFHGFKMHVLMANVFLFRLFALVGVHMAQSRCGRRHVPDSAQAHSFKPFTSPRGYARKPDKATYRSLHSLLVLCHRCHK